MSVTLSKVYRPRPGNKYEDITGYEITDALTLIALWEEGMPDDSAGSVTENGVYYRLWRNVWLHSGSRGPRDEFDVIMREDSNEFVSVARQYLSVTGRALDEMDKLHDVLDDSEFEFAFAARD